MKNTTEAKAINDYIAEQNAKFEARCKAEGATWKMVLLSPSGTTKKLALIN